MLLFQAANICDELQGLLVVAVAYAGVHELRDLQNFKDLRVAVQGQVVHAAALGDLLGLFCKIPDGCGGGKTAG